MIYMVKQIIGLDPSSYWDPDTLSKNDYLDASDANFVDIIHSDGTPVFYGAGINRQLGHADFYPNNGYKYSHAKDFIF